MVCADLPLPQQAVQACHASIAAGQSIIHEKNPYLVLVTVPDQHALIALSAELTKAGIAHRVFAEDDLGGRPTALATEPVPQEKRKYFRRLPLYRPEELQAA